MSVPPTAKSRSPRLIIPLQSRRPTGMGVAAAAAEDLWRDCLPGYQTDPSNRWFERINQLPLPAVSILFLRLLLVQLLPLVRPKSYLVFASHHAPLFNTHRHAVIIHDLISLHHPGQHRLQTWYFRRLVPRILKSAHRLITISQAVADDLRMRYPKACPARIEVIPSWSREIDLPVAERRPRMPEVPPCFLVLGANFLHKNLQLAVEAVREVRDRGVEVRLQVVGVRPNLWHRAGVDLTALSREGWLRWMSYASIEEVRIALSSATALLYLSSTEGMGLPPLEALAAGCPAVCADIPVLRETAGEAAFYVPLDDRKAIADLLEGLATGALANETADRLAAAPEVLARYSRKSLASRWNDFLVGVSPGTTTPRSGHPAACS